ncbi:MAG: VWA domain-containing protein, partial [Bryobacteraceae bacterium]
MQQLPYRLSWKILFAALLVGATAFSQTPGKSQAQQGQPAPAASRAALAAQTPPLRVAARLVQVSVIVQDKKGQPVPGLSKSDFQIADQGQPQEIAFFSEETNAPPAAAPVSLAAPNSYSNRLTEKAGVPTSVTVILLDALNTQFRDMGYARLQIVKFLKQLQPQDRVALYGLSNKLYVLHDFTNDASTLLAALDRSKGQQRFEMDATNPDPSDTGDDQVDAF